MRRGSAISGSARGFTLLELLIATAVGAIVLLVIQTTFFGALRLHNTTTTRTEEDLGLQRALAIVRRDFSGLMLPGTMLAGHLQSTVFSSSLNDAFGERVSPDIFTNSGKIDGWSPFADVQKVAYFLAAATDTRVNGVNAGKNLVRAVTRNLLPVQEEAGEPQVLLHGVSEATMQFYDGAGWVDTWDSEATTTLPTALKLRLVLATGESGPATLEPIELIVPVLVKTTATVAAEAEAGAVL
jgi:general secretion pathway protein J